MVVAGLRMQIAQLSLGIDLIEQVELDIKSNVPCLGLLPNINKFSLLA